MLEISILDIKSIKKKRKEKKRIEKKPQIGYFDKLFLLLNIYIYIYSILIVIIFKHEVKKFVNHIKSLDFFFLSKCMYHLYNPLTILITLVFV